MPVPELISAPATAATSRRADTAAVGSPDDLALFWKYDCTLPVVDGWMRWRPRAAVAARPSEAEHDPRPHEVRALRQAGRPMPRWKRAMDVVGALVALVALAPLLVFVAALIKLTSRGPVLYRQQRVGQDGVTFTMLKFRTMVDGADAQKGSLRHLNEMSGPLFKIRKDPRVTALGRLLRRTSVDELPQFWNVLVGDMSLVGPRPATPDEVAQYEPWQLERLSVRQGLTCYWQVEGRGRVGFPDCVRMDLRYAARDVRPSFVTDVRILLRTVAVVVTGRGAC